jgi:hypothetical protein
MRKLAALSIILGLGAFSSSFADDPPATSTAAAQSTPASSATTAVATTATAPPASAKTTSSDVASVAQVHRLRSAGYKPKVKDGTTVWCKQQTALGSRLTQVEFCGSADQIEQNIQDSKDAVEVAQRRVTEHQSN